MKRVAFKTLGCRLNQFETDAIASQFSKNGYQLVEFTDDADVYIVNSCTVTNQSDKRSRNSISGMLRRRNPQAITVVTGCMATHYADKLRENNDLTYVVENDHKTAIFNTVEAHFRGQNFDYNNLERDVFSYQTAETTFHTRSTIKIQDGCDNFCTFCIVPKVRGRAVSRPQAEILDNIRNVLQAGFKEIVLSGVNITRYNHNGVLFDDLLESILAIDGDFRVRIPSIEPEGFGEKFYELLQHPKMTPHLHLCLQSGSDKVLLQMRRMYTLTRFREIVDRIKSDNPSFNFTTDIIVGFPNETEQDFRQTCNQITEIGFTHIHTFKYSIRNGTRAARMPEQIDERIKTQRSEVVRQLADANKLTFRKNMVGQTQHVLVEKINPDGTAQGYGQHYVPVLFSGQNLQRNQFYTVKTTGLEMQDDEPVLRGFAE